MYLKDFKVELDEAAALSKAVELARVITAFMPSVALVEILLEFGYRSTDTSVYFYSRVKTTPEQHMLMNTLVFTETGPMGSTDFGACYYVRSKRGGNPTELEELCAGCYHYPWFAPVELKGLTTPPGCTNQVVSIRVPCLLTDEHIFAEYPAGSGQIHDFPHIYISYVEQ